MKKIVSLLLFSCLLFNQCQPTERNQQAVRIRLPVDPQSLNPVSYPNIYALQIVNLLFQLLLTWTMDNSSLP